MTKRCRFCGVKMAEVVINGKTVWQCPFCGSVAEKEVPVEVPVETASEPAESRE